MSVYKVPLEQNVLEAAEEPIMWTLEAIFWWKGFRTHAAPDGNAGAQNE